MTADLLKNITFVDDMGLGAVTGSLEDMIKIHGDPPQNGYTF